MEKVRSGTAEGVRPTFISDYLERHGARGWVTVGPGAWNTVWHHGTGFVSVDRSVAQQQALTRAAELSEAVDAARRNAIAIGAANPDLYRHLEDALVLVLRAETSRTFRRGLGPAMPRRSRRGHRAPQANRDAVLLIRTATHELAVCSLLPCWL